MTTGPAEPAATGKRRQIGADVGYRVLLGTTISKRSPSTAIPIGLAVTPPAPPTRGLPTLGQITSCLACNSPQCGHFTRTSTSVRSAPHSAHLAASGSFSRPHL